MRNFSVEALHEHGVISLGEEFSLSGEPEKEFTIRSASLSDINAILRLVNDYASKSIMLPRTELEMCESLRDFLVAEVEGKLVGCGALHFYTPHMAELRSLAIVPEHAGSGLGRKVTEAILVEAHKSGVDVVFAFTYVPGFFEKMGFRTVDRGALPLKVWKDCVRCPKFSACDEIAMAYSVTPGAEIYMSAAPPDFPSEDLIIFPKLGVPRILKDIESL